MRIFIAIDFSFMTLEELISKHQGEYISYIQYLFTEEWLNKRQVIIERDNHKCTNCKRGSTFYIKNWGSPIKYHLWNINNTGEHAPWHIKGDNSLTLADKHYHLEVHHKKYILNRLPWDYKNDDLTTLCNHCHTDFHNNNKVPVFSEDGLIELEYEVCTKCNGAGHLPEYNHVENGICFQCKGERYMQPLIRR